MKLVQITTLTAFLFVFLAAGRTPVATAPAKFVKSSKGARPAEGVSALTLTQKRDLKALREEQAAQEVERFYRPSMYDPRLPPNPPHDGMGSSPLRVQNAPSAKRSFAPNL